jgi:hypothetical protein
MPGMKLAIAALTLGFLSACVASGNHNGPYSPLLGSAYERQVVGALGEITASSAQRQAVLAAYDQMAPLLKQNDADDIALQRDWRALDPKATDYLSQADALAQQAAALSANRLKALARFNQTVAATLDAGQWAEWSRVMSDRRAAFENGRRLNPSFRPDL